VNTAQTIVGVVLIAIGLGFMLLGSIGIVRFPDFFTRTHATSKVDTAGIIVVLLGLAVLGGVSLTSGKVLLGAAFLMVANPVAGHALARAALREGELPWRKKPGAGADRES
jgi:multicomponent Na+:H+ antiporter subunit G